jgi:hypothetical protein
MPLPILPRDDPDYVWDVFYHRAGLLNDYDAVGNVATLYVKPQDDSRTVRDELLNQQLRPS